MADAKYLATDEVAERYRNLVSVGTLENWRAQRIGPPFVKIGKAVLYPVEELDAWDRRSLVSCDDAKIIGRRRDRSNDGLQEHRPFR
ncbi:helix-turn-helix domain-containing protein [Caulobacter sp.]|uniref:helix-turn-helix domain-containing protein n=1 Tax=Caulobacter sp. TaxID=78 RepID=UPI003BAD642E